MEQELEKQRKIQLASLTEELNLLNIDDISHITGWTKSTIRNVIKYDKEFPVLQIGKSDLVMFESLKKYLSTRRNLRGKFDEKLKLKLRKE